MFSIIAVLTGTMLRVFRTRRNLLLENLVLRQQLTVFKRKRPRPRIAALDKLFWVLARRFWSGWKQALIVVTPDTVVRWHLAGFALYWRAISRARRVFGRKTISKEVRNLIFRMVKEKPTWGAPRIHGELQMLGFDVSERTVSRWMRRAPRNPEPAERWLTFLRNHREAIAGMDFFTVSTVAFRLLYYFFVISHDRRRILHINVTRHPTSTWIIQQLRETFPFQLAPKFLIFDRDSKFNFEVAAAVRSLGVNSVRTSFESPWQNGIAERWVESCRHDLLDHVKPQTPESATLRLTQLGRATTRRGILLLHSFLSVFRRARVEVQACCERMRLINFSAGWTFGKAQAPKSGFRRTWKPMRWTMTGP